MNPYATDNDVSDDEIDELIELETTIENGDVLKDGRGNEYTVIIDNSGNVEIHLIDDDREDGGE